MEAFRCAGCSRLLFKGVLVSGSRIEIKCSHRDCRQLTTFSAESATEMESDGQGGWVLTGLSAAANLNENH